MTVKSGQLEPLKLFKVFRSLAERQLTGVLTVRRGSVVKQAQMVGGQPYRSASNVQSEGLLWGLVEEGLLSSTEKIQVEERAAREQVRPEALLVSLDLVARNRLASVERRLSRRRLAEAFGWADGEFTFEPRSLSPPADVDPIDPVHLMLEAAARYLPAALPARFVRMYPAQLVCPTPLFDAHGQHYDRYYPPPNLRRYLQQPTDVERLGQVHGDAEDVARQVFTLVVSGLCQFNTIEALAQRAAPPPPPPPPPQRLAPAPPPPPPPVPASVPPPRPSAPVAAFASAVPVAQAPPRSATGSMAAAAPTHGLASAVSVPPLAAPAGPGTLTSAPAAPGSPSAPPPGPPRVGMRGAPVAATPPPTPPMAGASMAGAPVPATPAAPVPAAPAAPVPATPARTAPPAAAPAVRPVNAGRVGQGGALAGAATPMPRSAPLPRTPGGSLVADRPAAGEARDGARRPAPERSAPERATPPAEVLARLEQAKTLFRSLDTATHYTVLGVARSATPEAVRQAFRQLASLFHSDRYVRFAISDADRAVVQKVFIAINKASEVLGDAARRREYDAGLDAGIKPSTPGGAGAQIDQVFKAEKLVRDAVLLLRNNQPQPALEKLDEALAITADDPLAQAARLFADFSIVQARGPAPQMAARTRDALKAITAEYQGRDEPFVYLGRVHRGLGENEAAAAAFEAALRANPRCAEAASELRFLQRHAPKSDKTGDSGRSGGLFGLRKK